MENCGLCNREITFESGAVRNKSGAGPGTCYSCFAALKKAGIETKAGLPSKAELAALRDKILYNGHANFDDIASQTQGPLDLIGHMAVKSMDDIGRDNLFMSDERQKLILALHDEFDEMVERIAELEEEKQALESQQLERHSADKRFFGKSWGPLDAIGGARLGNFEGIQ